MKTSDHEKWTPRHVLREILKLAGGITSDFFTLLQIFRLALWGYLKIKKIQRSKDNYKAWDAKNTLLV